MRRRWKRQGASEEGKVGEDEEVERRRSHLKAAVSGADAVARGGTG